MFTSFHSENATPGSSQHFQFETLPPIDVFIESKGVQVSLSAERWDVVTHTNQEGQSTHLSSGFVVPVGLRRGKMKTNTIKVPP
jgi:hypothetical protein